MNRLTQLQNELRSLELSRARKINLQGNTSGAVAAINTEIRACKIAIQAEQAFIGLTSGRRKRPNPRRRKAAKKAKLAREAGALANLSSALPKDLPTTDIRTNGKVLGNLKERQHKVAGSGLIFQLDRKKYEASPYCKPHERRYKRFSNK